MKFGKLRFIGSADVPMLGEGRTIDFMVHQFEIDGVSITLCANGKQNRVMDIDRPENEWIDEMAKIYGTNYEWIYPLSEERITLETPDPEPTV